MFDFFGRAFVVESFYPRYGRGTSPSLLRLFLRLGTIGSEIARLAPGTWRVSIRLRRTLNHRDAKTLEGQVLRLAREAATRSRTEASLELSTPLMLCEDASDLATISIEDITGIVPDPDFAGGNPMQLEPRTLAVLFPRSISVDQAIGLRDGPLPEGERGSRIRLIDAPALEPELTASQEADALVTKLQRKVSQIGALPAGAARLLLINLPWLDDTEDPERVSQARVILQRIDERIVRGRSRMGGILAVTRVWTGKRHQYHGVMLEGAEGEGLTGRIEDGLNDLEGTSELLRRW